MFVYFFVFFVILISALLPLDLDKKLKSLFLLILFIILLIFIGLRYNVGGDWISYLNYYQISANPLPYVILQSDPGYMLINWTCAKLGLGMGTVNLISGFFFLYGLFFFIENLKLPFHSYVIAYPYMIMIIAMGYTRQSIALGFLMIAFVLYSKGKLFKSLWIILLASLFHKTAIFGLIILFANKTFLLNPLYFIFGVSIFLFIFNLMESKFLVMYDVYVGRNAQSGGALPRIFLNFIAGISYLIFYKNFKNYFKRLNTNIWIVLSLMSIVNFLLIPFSSTVADRISIYLLPLQLIVFSLIYKVIKNSNIKNIIFLFVIAIYILYLIVWLFFANHRFEWIPYQNYLFIEGF